MENLTSVPGSAYIRTIILRGFSMGGAGAWHIALHYPDRWAAADRSGHLAETFANARLSAVSASGAPHPGEHQ